MRKAGLVPFLAGLVLLALACQGSQEVDGGAPVDTTATTMTEEPPDEEAPAGGGEGGGGELALGGQVYEANCATCHGTNGGGDGPAGAGLQPPPADFTDTEWKYGNDLESVKNTIFNGIPGTAMIAWKGTLSDAEVEAVAKHVIAFSQGGAAAD